ncbi:MAG TPA: periplasmic heavy metal sensor [Polyangiaceae bacterium]|nr:periplasmic heavy metal sensor [Polyangiaceae bacterium]
MFGFLFGAACLGGLAALLFRRHHHHYGCGHGHGHGRFHRGRHFMNAAFERLDTTPGQEKAVVAAIDEFRDSARAVRQKVMASRGDVAAALREERFEPERVRAVLSRNAEEVATLGDAGAQALAKVHEALDPEQRKRLARWIESGPGFFYA